MAGTVYGIKATFPEGLFNKSGRCCVFSIFRSSLTFLLTSSVTMTVTEGKNQALFGAIPYCGEYPGPQFEDKFRSANQMGGISKADEIKWLSVNL